MKKYRVRFKKYVNRLLRYVEQFEIVEAWTESQAEAMVIEIHGISSIILNINEL